MDIAMEITALPINRQWTRSDGSHDGGVSTGIGFTIAWQRGSLVQEGRNGAFLIEVLEACRNQLRYYQNGSFACEENQAALEALSTALDALNGRRDRRMRTGKLGTHQTDD